MMSVGFVFAMMSVGFVCGIAVIVLIMWIEGDDA